MANPQPKNWEDHFTFISRCTDEMMDSEGMGESEAEEYCEMLWEGEVQKMNRTVLGGVDQHGDSELSAGLLGLLRRP
jgi:hypothetical protein